MGRALGLSETGQGGSPASVSVWERPTQRGLSIDSVVDPERRDGHQPAGRVVAFHSRPNSCLLAGSKARRGISGEPLGWCVSGLTTHVPQSLRGFGGEVRVSVQLAAKQSKARAGPVLSSHLRGGRGHPE